MNKLLIVALGASAAVASASAAAADATGAFFVNAGVGQAQYHIGRTSGDGYRVEDKDTAGAARFGYKWDIAEGFHAGFEGGYTELGTMKAETDYGPAYHSNVKAKGWLFGVNGKYDFAEKWYVQARGGWFRSKVETKASLFDPISHAASQASGSREGDGWYGGLGFGYDVTPNFSLGLDYDNYQAKAKFQYSSYRRNIGTYMLTAEYRF